MRRVLIMKPWLICDHPKKERACPCMPLVFFDQRIQGRLARQVNSKFIRVSTIDESLILRLVSKVRIPIHRLSKYALLLMGHLF